MQVAEVLKLHILSSRMSQLLTKAVGERPVFHFREAAPSLRQAELCGHEYLRPAFRLSSSLDCALAGQTQREKQSPHLITEEKGRKTH